MRTPDQAVWDFVHDWLEKAGEDLRAARVLLRADEAVDAVVCFHSQQAVEKFFKAVLVRHQVEFSKTHDVERLRSLIRSVDGDLADNLADTDILTEYAVRYRYPGASPDIGRLDAESALGLAEVAERYIRRHLRPYIERGRPPHDD